MAQNIGKIVQVIGPTVDCEFNADSLPNILNAIKIFNPETKKELVVEVALHIGDNVVRCVAMASTDGLVRGMEAVDTGTPITVPVGKESLGRIFNLLGETIDGKDQVPADNKRLPIHRMAPSFDEQSTSSEMFETGIKVIDLLEPYSTIASITSFTVGQLL